MAKKLVFDRTINLNFRGSQSAIVPASELWKITVTRDILCNGGWYLAPETSHLVGEGTKLSHQASSDSQIVGIAFKVVEV